MKESGENHLKCAVNESTLSTAGAVLPSPMGKAAKREYRFPRIVISRKARNLPCTTVKRRAWDKEQHLGVFFSFPHTCSTPPGRKDPSTTLGMTIRENGRSHIHFHPAAETTSAPSVTSIKKYRQVSLTVSDLYPHHVVKAGF